METKRSCQLTASLSLSFLVNQSFEKKIVRDQSRIDAKNCLHCFDIIADHCIFTVKYQSVRWMEHNDSCFNSFIDQVILVCLKRSECLFIQPQLPFFIQEMQNSRYRYIWTRFILFKGMSFCHKFLIPISSQSNVIEL